MRYYGISSNKILWSFPNAAQPKVLFQESRNEDILGSMGVYPAEMDWCSIAGANRYIRDKSTTDSATSTTSTSVSIYKRISVLNQLI